MWPMEPAYCESGILGRVFFASTHLCCRLFLVAIGTVLWRRCSLLGWRRSKVMREGFAFPCCVQSAATVDRLLRRRFRRLSDPLRLLRYLQWSLKH